MSLQQVDWQIAYNTADNPLTNFYIPALSHSIRYDRSAGFFSSSALAIAASGIVHLIHNGGTMRLLVGAQLAEADVIAVERGAQLEELITDKLLTALHEPEDVLMRRRLEILAWMVANQTLTIRVVVPRDPITGRPIANSPDYYHPKEGLFTDADGNQMAFSGSINESLTAWRHNYEQFSVYFSWDETYKYLAQVKARFDKVWDDRDQGWIGIDIPTAARHALVNYAPAHAPEYDPLAAPPDDLPASAPLEIVDDARWLQAERLKFQFLRDAPTLPNSSTLGAATSAIEPWPHQIRVAQQVIEQYPRRSMLCDEVGLGKTIEAGLILRQLRLSGLVKRCLLLAPKSVTRQWQEELYEKFGLDVPLYDGKEFRAYDSAVLEPRYDDPNPWNRFDFFIASSQLAKREDRRAQLTSARSWDLVVVDEAHHARRKDFLQPTYRPNRLLSLLTDPEFKSHSTLLMTATPMQVNPLEVWDLLKVLGMGGKWGADEDNFLEFYTQLRQPDFKSVDWDFVLSMVCDYLGYGGELRADYELKLKQTLGPVLAQTIKKLTVEACPKPSSDALRRLPPKAHEHVREFARLHTPLHHLMFRNTRDLLRQYVKMGILDQNVPSRDPHPVWITLTAHERELYDRIEEYISTFYNKYEKRRAGLGFVMTIYRRRLTSSFYAVRKSLERRLAFLEGRVNEWVTDEDTEQGDLSEDLTEIDEGPDGALYREEIDYVKNFLHELTILGNVDSKVEQLLLELNRLFLRHRTVLVFTQYTDTMDYLREVLTETYGTKVACYSGRGGEVRNGIAWVEVPKEQIKREFREGATIRILLCTEAASEGLNLQTCGVLINHDMPWNPMRVEQRIGRIDRIGQIHDVVDIYNYFYQDTIEARVYQSLADRIGWFEGVVGELQPILARVGRVIEELVMTTPAEREARFQERLRELEQTLDDHNSQTSLDVYEATEIVERPVLSAPPATLRDLEEVFVTSQQFKWRFTAIPEAPGIYQLGERRVTFSPEIFDAHPNSVEFLTYGSALLDQLFEQAEPPIVAQSGAILRLAVTHPLPLTAYYAVSNHALWRIESLDQFERALHEVDESHWTPELEAQARRDFDARLNMTLGRLSSTRKLQITALEAAALEQVKVLLCKAALIEYLRLNGDQALVPAKLDASSVLGLGEKYKYPFSTLVNFAGHNLPIVDTGDPHLKDMLMLSPEKQRSEFASLKGQGEKLVAWINKLQAAMDNERFDQGPPEFEAAHFRL